jgi:hypothetical protein
LYTCSVATAKRHSGPVCLRIKKVTESAAGDAGGSASLQQMVHSRCDFNPQLGNNGTNGVYTPKQACFCFLQAPVSYPVLGVTCFSPNGHTPGLWPSFEYVTYCSSGSKACLTAQHMPPVLCYTAHTLLYLQHIMSHVRLPCFSMHHMRIACMKTGCPVIYRTYFTYIST